MRDNILQFNESTTRHLDSLLEATSASLYWKDKNGIYLGVNSVFVKYANIKNDNEVIGKSDSELIWDKQAPILMENDKRVVVSQKKKTVIEPISDACGTIHYFLSHKAPLRSITGKVIGTLGLSFLASSEN